VVYGLLKWCVTAQKDALNAPYIDYCYV